LKDVGYEPKKEEDKKLKNFVLDDSKLPQRLDHAVGKIKIEEQEFRYYGARINEIVLKGQKGGMVQTTQLSPAIILENGRIMTQNNKPEDVNFVFDSVMTLKRNRWSLNSIKDFCQNKINKKEYTFEEVFNDIKKIYKKSMVFDNELWYDLLSLRDIKSYFWDLNDKFIIIKHEGISGTAKSKGMKIGANLSFNGKKFLCPTPANFFRYRHHNKATLFIEEVERLFDNSKKKNTADSDLVEYLNGSYEKGNSVPRQNDKDISITDEFDPAGDSALGSIAPLKGALEKRSIPLHMIKASKNDERGNVEVPTETDEDYSSVRNKSYICGLLNYKKYEKNILSVENNYGLANRQWILSKPLIALAKCVSLDLEKEIGVFLARLFEVRDDSFDEQSWEVIMAKALIKLYSKYEEERFFGIDELKERFLIELNRNSPTQYNISNTKIGMIMVELGFSQFKANPSGAKRGYRISFMNVMEILIRQEILRLENILKEVSEVSECKYNDDKIKEWYTYTYLTPYTINDNKSDTLTYTTPVLGVGSEQKSKFTDEEIKKAGYSDEEIKDFYKEGIL